jgi:hypothetical protein
MTSAAFERAGEAREADARAARPAADVPALLTAYKGSLGLVRRPPPSIRLPARSPWRRLTAAVHLRLRPTWFAERWAARELRRRADVLERGIAERLALGGDPTPDELRDRDALRNFKESLVPRLSALVAAIVFVGWITLAQALTNGLLVYQYRGEEGALPTALGGISVTPDPADISTLVGAIADADLNVLFAFVMGLLGAAYIIGRVPACGYRLARLALGERDGLGVPRRTSDLSRAVATLNVRATEAAVFASVERPRPREFPVDLAVKALMAAGWLYVAIFSLRGNADESDYWEFIVFAVLAGLRLLWLAVASVVRGAGVAWIAVPLAILVAGAMIAAPEEPFDEELTAGDPGLSFTLSLRSDLAGVDLRERDLTRAYLVGKDLSRANLTGAELSEAELTGATLRGAVLYDAVLSTAQLEGADLRGAVLDGADLGGAYLQRADLRRASLIGANLEWTDLCGADLRGATLDGVTGIPFFNERTRWPAGYTPRRNPDEDLFGC